MVHPATVSWLPYPGDTAVPSQDLHPGNILVRERSLSGNNWLSWLLQGLVQLPPKVVFLGESPALTSNGWLALKLELFTFLAAPPLVAIVKRSTWRTQEDSRNNTKAKGQA
eukprot:1152269-Pelagomonas_calceolata.AAC.1